MPVQSKLTYAPIGVIDMGRASGGGSGARRLVIDGVRHICKCPQYSNGLWVCFNEFLAARIATRLELPVPSFKVIQFQGSLPARQSWFCSEEIQPAGTLDGSNCTSLVNKEAACGILLLDLWLCNVDRKNEHLVTRSSGTESKLFMIDHGHILLTSGELPVLASAEFQKPARFLSGSADLCKCVSNVNELGVALEAIRKLDEGGAWRLD